MEGEDGILTREREESKEPSSDAGADGMVRDEAGIDKPVDACVAAPKDGAGGMITEEAASDSSPLCSERAG